MRISPTWLGINSMPTIPKRYNKMRWTILAEGRPQGVEEVRKNPLILICIRGRVSCAIYHCVITNNEFEGIIKRVSQDERSWQSYHGRSQIVPQWKRRGRNSPDLQVKKSPERSKEVGNTISAKSSRMDAGGSKKHPMLSIGYIRRRVDGAIYHYVVANNEPNGFIRKATWAERS